MVRQTYGYRTFPVHNTTDEWIPSYAIMRLVDMFDDSGDAVRNVAKPDAMLAVTQDPAMCIINGPTRIPPNSEGQGSQDWPLQVLHAVDGATTGANVGPVADKWAVSYTGRAFVLQGSDPTTAYGGDDTHDLGFVIATGASGIAGFMSTEDHPGKGTLFTVNAGIWDPVAHEWGYDDTIEFFAIDNRAGVPSPEFPATGLGAWRPSKEHGIILEVFDMDCVGDSEEPIS